MTALLPDRTTRSAAEVGHDLQAPPAARPPGTAGRGARRRRHPHGLPGRRRRRLVPHRRRRARRPARRSPDRRAGLADGPRLRGPRRRASLVTLMPLGITLVCAWAVWRTAHRLGDSVSGHGPDAGRIADGERDWTVPVAAFFFLVGYVVTAVVTASAASTPTTAPDLSHVVLWSVRALRPARRPGDRRRLRPRGDLGLVPAPARWSRPLAACRSGALHLAVALPRLLPRRAAARHRHRPQPALAAGHRRTGATGLLAVVSVLLVPNAVLFSGSYLLGPGFTVGVGTDRLAGRGDASARCRCSRCSPPCPTAGPRPAGPRGWCSCRRWSAALGAIRAQRTRPTLRYEEGALHGCAGGMLAGLRCSALLALAGRRRGRPGPDDRRRPRVVGRSCSTRSPPSGSAVCSAAWPSRGGSAGRPSRPNLLLNRLHACQRASSSSSRGPAPTSRPCSTRRRTRRTAPTVVAVGADRDGIEGLERAERAGIPTFVHRVKDFDDRAAWDRALTGSVAEHRPDLVVSAGFMKLVGAGLPGGVRGQVPQHPPGAEPELPGHARPGRRAGVRRQGHRLHPLRGRRRASTPGRSWPRPRSRCATTTTSSSLHERIKVAERAMLVDTVGRMAREGFSINDRKVRIG